MLIHCKTSNAQFLECHYVTYIMLIELLDISDSLEQCNKFISNFLSQILKVYLRLTSINKM